MKTDPCTEILKNLHRVMEDDAPAGLCKAVQAHLETCASCRKQREALRELVVLCKRFPEETMPEEQKRKMKEELKRLLSSEERTQPNPRSA